MSPRTAAFLTCLWLVLIPFACRAETWNVGDDFSPLANPGGAWSYGWRSNPETPMVLYTEHSDHTYWGCELDTWYYDLYEWVPAVMHNAQADTLVCGPFGVVTVPPNGVTFHPGPDQQSVIRWTSPYSMTVAIHVLFAAADHGSSQVHVYHDGTELFTAGVSGVGDTVEFTGTLELEPGNTVDCAVTPISFYFDTVLVDMTLQGSPPVPVQETSWGGVKALFRKGGDQRIGSPG